jgi:hypothetical protein
LNTRQRGGRARSPADLRPISRSLTAPSSDIGRACIDNNTSWIRIDCVLQGASMAGFLERM